MRRSDGSTEWWPRHRPSPRRSELSRATSSRWCSANVDILAANAQTLAASRRLREALKSCSQRHLIYSMPRNYRASQPRRKLDHSNKSCRRLHGLGEAHRCIMHQAIAGMFHARASVTPKRVLRSLRTQKVLTTVRQIARATPGAPRTARPSKCAISQSKHEPEAACPYTHNRAEKLCTRDLVTPKNASRDLFAVTRCS